MITGLYTGWYCSARASKYSCFVVVVDVVDVEVDVVAVVAAVAGGRGGSRGGSLVVSLPFPFVQNRFPGGEFALLTSHSTNDTGGR